MRVATIRSWSTRNTSGGDSCAMTQAKFRLMRTWRNEEEDMKRTTEKMRFLRSRALDDPLGAAASNHKQQIREAR